MKGCYFILILLTFTIEYVSGQEKVGINTNSPQATLHVNSSGQVHTPGGLVMMGNVDEAHLLMDFDYLQARYGPLNSLPLLIQPMGGDVMINGNASLSPVVGPQSRLHVWSPGSVLTQNGLLLLGDTSEANLRMDFNYIQSQYNGAGLELDLQPQGGNLDILDGALFVKHPEGFVGINSQNPQEELWVAGEMAFSIPPVPPDQEDKVSLNGNKIDLATMVGFGYLNQGGIASSQGANPARSVIDMQELYYKSNGAHRWYISQNAGLLVNPRMILDPNARLGINTAIPLARLHLQEDAGASLIYAQAGVNDRFIVENDGDVGIGTGTPLSDLHVTSNNSSIAQLLLVPDVGLTGTADLLLGEDDDFTYGMAIQYDGSDNKLKIWGKENMSNHGPHITVERNNGDVAIGYSGNVPNGYKLAVSGKIISEGLRCELTGNWADYVFDPEHERLSFNDLRRYLERERHLPGMPSEDEMRQSGLDFETVTVQQQVRIEELYLYLLDLQEQLEVQALEIRDLRKENVRLSVALENTGR